MQDDKWEALKEELGRKFKVEEAGFEDLTVHSQDGDIVSGRAEFIIFESPIGRTKLVRESRPVVLDKKMIYSHQQGKSARTEYKFSETEFSHKIKAFIWDNYNEQWKEIDSGAFDR